MQSKRKLIFNINIQKLESFFSKFKFFYSKMPLIRVRLSPTITVWTCIAVISESPNDIYVYLLKYSKFYFKTI